MPEFFQNTLHIDYVHFEHASRIPLQVSLPYLTTRSRYSLENLTVPQTGKIIFCILWNLKFYKLLHKGPPFVPILNQMNTVDALLTHLFTLNYNIFPSTLRSSKWPISFRVSYQNLVCISPSALTCHTLRQIHTPRFHYQKIFGHLCITRRFSSCRFLQLVATLSRTSEHPPQRHNLERPWPLLHADMKQRTELQIFIVLCR